MPKTPRKKNKETKDYSRVFAEFGMEFSGNGSTQVKAEECPYCGEGKFYLNIETGGWDCKSCHKEGYIPDFLTAIHELAFEQTTTKHFQALKAKRGGVSLQTLERHGLAYDESTNQWLIPYKNPKGQVVNIQRYDALSGKKYNLPGLATSLFGLDRLSKDKTKILFLCEGPFDAIALDYRLGIKRGKYDILASPGAFQACWAKHCEGRKVRGLYDNDDGGDAHRKQVQKLLGESGVAKELRLLRWPDQLPDGKDTPKGFDINDFVMRFPKISIPGFIDKYSVKVVAEPKLNIHHAWQDQMKAPKKIDWVWLNHIRCGTYVSFSGVQGTLKTTIMVEIAARYSTGRAMPGDELRGMPAGHVLYVHAEDDKDTVELAFNRAGGDLTKLTTIAATLRDGDPLNMLEHLKELEQLIGEYSIRLVVIDGQNSVVGAPDISTDMKGRHNVTNRLHQFAQRLNICLVGIRNEDANGRAMGSQSMGDLSRCVMRANRLDDHVKTRCYELCFVKVSDAAPSTHPTIRYQVKDCGGNHRQIEWGKGPPKLKKSNQQ